MGEAEEEGVYRGRRRRGRSDQESDGKGIGRWWEKKIGRKDVGDAVSPRRGEVTPNRSHTRLHIVFRCRKIRRVKDERGRRDWATEDGIDNVVGMR